MGLISNDIFITNEEISSVWEFKKLYLQFDLCLVLIPIPSIYTADPQPNIHRECRDAVNPRKFKNRLTKKDAYSS